MAHIDPHPGLFGRYAVAEPLRGATLHLHDGAPLREVSWDIPIPVLDQQDLIRQGIDTSRIVPGAQRADALGSCTCNAGTASLAERTFAAKGRLPEGVHPTDPVADECYAIALYHEVTDQTGDPAREWPPTDCGSTGLYVCTELEHQRLISSHRSAPDVASMLSLLQQGTVIMGAPWFRSWMEPDRYGFVDGDGSYASLVTAIESGVAGGHETCIAAAERLMEAAGDLSRSHVRVRNSWGRSWGDSGSYRIHCSTLAMLGSHVDFKAFVI